MSLFILKQGALDTIQDLGRSGYASWGMNPSGVMDRYAAPIANALVGNEPGQGLIELHFPAGEYRFENDALISLTGANFLPHINGTPVPVWKTIFVPRGSVLSFRKKISGSRCYLAIRKGFDLDLWLKSQSTNLKIQRGGLYGRAFQRGDSIPFQPEVNKPAHEVTVFPWSVNHYFVYENPGSISFLQGPQWNRISGDSQKELLNQDMSILPSSDRMASYLTNESLVLTSNEEILSTAVTFGSLQILPNGKLLVLMADHQTTGGYPLIGSVISAHLPKFSQLSPGDLFRLSKISVEDAEKKLFSLQQELALIARACKEKLKDL